MIVLGLELKLPKSEMITRAASLKHAPYVTLATNLIMIVLYIRYFVMNDVSSNQKLWL